MASKPLRDSDVRKAAYARLLSHARTCPNTLVIDELGLDHGSCRIDIAVINGHIRGLEIKAEADTLDRLPHQVAAYGEVVDKASLRAKKSPGQKKDRARSSTAWPGSEGHPTR